MSNNILGGNWIYRSYLNDQSFIGDDPQKALNQIFGEGELQFLSNIDQNFKAVLDFGNNMKMDLFGTVINTAGLTPQTLLITGTGREGTSTAKWVYQYQGYIVPDWPQGVDQVPAILGTVVRTIPHGSGAAGVVASFIAIKQK
jgi:hypothetical protein